MRLVGFDSGHGTIVGDRTADGRIRPICEVEEFWSDPFRRVQHDSSHPLVDPDSVRLVPPVRPSARIICVGLNYHDHVAEGPFTPPEHPEYFARWTPALGVSGQAVVVPQGEPGLDWEAELVVVVGRPMREVDAEGAMNGVLGYATFNDITARRAQHRGRQWTLGKNVDSSGALGPISLATDVGDPRAGWKIRADVNGETVQSSSTDRLIFDVGTLLSDLSQTLTLQPGDLLATGTPDGVGHRREPQRFLHEGDLVTVSIEGLEPVSSPILEKVLNA